MAEQRDIALLGLGADLGRVSVGGQRGRGGKGQKDDRNGNSLHD